MGNHNPGATKRLPQGETAPSEESTVALPDRPIEHLARITAWPEEPIPTVWLRNGHARWGLILDEYEGADDLARQALFRRLLHEVRLHIEAEEQVLYPAIIDSNRQLEGMVTRFQQEHKEIGKILAKLSKLPQSGERFQFYFSRLTSILEEHAEGEEAEVFPWVETSLAERHSELSERIAALDGA